MAGWVERMAQREPFAGKASFMLSSGVGERGGRALSQEGSWCPEEPISAAGWRGVVEDRKGARARSQCPRAMLGIRVLGKIHGKPLRPSKWRLP